MDGVSFLGDQYRDSIVINSGADSVAKWDDNEYLLGYKNYSGGQGGVVGLNLVPSDYFGISGDYVQLLHNILFVSYLTPVEETAKDGKKNSFDTEITSITSGIFRASFSYPIKEKISLSVFDKIGRVVFEKEFFNANGLKNISFNAVKTDISSGIYFFRIESGKNLVKGKFLFISK